MSKITMPVRRRTFIQAGIALGAGQVLGAPFILTARGDEPVQYRLPAGVLQIQCQAAFVGVQRREDRRLLPPPLFGDGNAGDQPGAVRAAGRLHVDDLRAEHGEEVGAARARPEGRHVQHA